MRTLFRLVTLTAVVVTAGFAAATSTAATPAGGADFSVTINAPAVVHPGQAVSATVTIANLTESTKVAFGTWSIAGPIKSNLFGRGGKFSVSVPAFASVSKTLSFSVPRFAHPGAYTMTVSVAGAAAPAIATITVA